MHKSSQVCCKFFIDPEEINSAIKAFKIHILKSQKFSNGFIHKSHSLSKLSKSSNDPKSLRKVLREKQKASMSHWKQRKNLQENLDSKKWKGARHWNRKRKALQPEINWN